MYREDKSSSLVELLRQRAAHMPTQRAYTFLVDGEAEAATLTYGELDCRARALAAHLQKNHQPGERALLLYPSGLDYITAFFGCLYAGIVAVPLYPPHLRKADPRIEAIRADAQATLVLTEPKVLDKLTERLTDEADRSASHQSALHYIALEAVDEAFVDNWRPPTLTTDSLAYLQYTSGSTAAPKGVMVSHGNLLYNLGAFAEKQMHTPDDVFVSWLPFFHDMGLIYGVLYPLYQGLPGVLLSPTAFIQQPMRWLQAMTKYKATHTAAPNFAYALCIEKITPEQRSLLDLSDWRLALNGAETVRSATLARFTAAFAECGFRVQAYAPGYGLAEATLQVTLTAQTSNPTLLTVDTAALALNRVVVTDTLLTSWQMVGCGAPSAGTQIVIANPQTLARCSADEVGEIWVGGPTVAQGYWQRPDATRATFQAYLNDNGAGPFLRTGDLGFLHDGQLFITGRLKDLIIIRGRNHYPQDIEQTIEASHPALEPAGGAAFAVEVDGEERLVVLQEIRRTQRHALETETIFHAIRQTVAAAHDVQIYAIVLLKPASILKTSSGKIQRRACRTAYLQKELATIAEWQQPQLSQSLALQPNGGHTQSEQTALKSGRSISEVQGWLISHLAQITQLPVATIDAHQAFTYYGLDSATTVALTGQLSTWLGEKLPPTLAYDYPTIQKLAQHLGDNQAAPVNPLPTARHNDQPTVDEHKIAIIGLGCRFPGAENPAEFWQLLQAGVDAISLVPDERWPAGVLDAETATPGKLTTRWGGFLSNVDQFDPAFFAIAPLEATHIDPQQRLLLEVAWEALEYAGIALASLAGSATGVFVGISTNDYAQLPTDPSTRTHTYRGTGNAFSIAANRLSYLLDLRGPSLAIDTACSSSLVALHTACHSLRAQECSMALVGGVNLILSPNNTLIFSQAGMMAANGRCKTFDASADGYVRGEGCGVLVLKRLADAQRDGDNILAVIRGSAINQDGRTNGLTAPNGLAQQAVIQAALADAQVAPTQIGYVEAHGTGTALGDPIELVALKAVLLPGRPPEARGWIGSVKTNIGHLEAAAGIAGVIKVVLALQHREVPPHLHLQTLNPYISLDDTPLAIPTRQEPWTPIQGRRLAGVSSFGFGGSNAHMILEEAAQDGESGEVQETRLRREPGAHWARTGQGDREERTLHLLTLSAKNETGLQELVQRYLDYLTARPEMSLADICFTANTGRSHFPHRLALSAATTQQATTRLAALFAGEQSAGVAKGEAALGNQPRLAFLFSGQGSQYVGMGRELYETQPIFRTALDHCDEILRPLLGESILPVIYPETGDWSVASGTTNHPQSLSATLIDQTRYTQPALFALEYALATLWQAWGIQPDVLIGHSIGEVAAACVAGVFSLEDGLRLIAARGRLMGALPQGGEMVAVMADEAYVQKLIAPYQHQVSVAAINGPASVVISGKRGTVTAIVEQLTAAGIKTRQLTVSHAFHSPLMAPMLDVFRQVAESITYHPPKLRLISNITGQLAGDEIATSDYWVRHVRAAVRFADGVQTLHEQGIGIFLEIGPQPVLVALAQAIVDSRLTIDEKNSSAETIASPAMLPSLRPGRSDWQQMLESLGALYVQGVAIDWVGFDRDYLRRKVLLPTYPFQRQRYWIAPGEAQNRGAQPPNGFANWLTSTSTEQLTQLMADKGHFGADERETVARVLATLETESRSQQMAAQVESMLYEVAWEPSRPLMLPTLPTATGRWLVLADDTGVGEALATQLSELGQTVNVITATTELSEITTHLMIEAKAAPPLRGIVHLWGLTHPDLAAATLDVATLIQSQADTLGTLLHLVQTLAAHKGASPRLWVVTQGAQQLAAEQPVAVGQTPLWGLGRVVALEHSHLWGGLLDLDGTDVPAQSSKALLAELLQQRIDGENQVAYRNGVRYVARLARGKVKKVSAPPVAIHADACYLVTGGLGGLGLLVTNWLVTQGARHVVLTGRRGITQLAQQQIVAGWAAQGVSVQIAQVDVADEAGMRQLFAQLTASTNPLKGIFHTAGLLDDGILLKQSWARFTNVLTAKVGGSWLLHQLTQGIELDVLVYFSSVASLLGNLGQGNYAAANAFMDGLARHRQQQGLPGLSINWGGWAEVGMAARTAQVKADSHPLMTPQEGVKALEHLLGHRGQIGVARFDWKQIAALNREPQPFLAKWIESHKPTRDKASFVQELEALPNNRRLAHVRNHLQQALGRVLGMTELPARDIGFADLGMDSLMALELKRQLERTLNHTLPSTLAFEYPTVDALATYLCTDVLVFADATSTPSSAEPRAMIASMTEPIAVLSIGCRFPGAATPEAFWQLLQDGVDQVQEIPPTRWPADDYYDAHRPLPGKMYTREGAFIEAVEQFDPLFFGIAPREATGMDPMHRLLLEVSWEALERAGLAQQDLVDSSTGVFVGIGHGDYGALNGQQDLADLDTHAVTNGGHSVAAGRLAYTLGLQGPTLAVDTACSSSLVSLHLACQSLRAGECDLALAGGVQLMLSPLPHVALSQMSALSPDGRCKTFDASADGYGRGEGGSMVVLKRLCDAQADGDTILAVIQGSAVNHDGPSSGLTVPNKRAQEKLLRQALANAGVTPAEVAYIEAHGTGTPLGDPIEIRALGAVFGKERAHPLLVGSVKTNVGHLEAAAGIAGFVKTVLALHHGQIPPHLHFTQPNPYIEWDEFAIEVPTTLQPWPEPVEGHTRVAGVSSFGISGTNAHIIVAAAPPPVLAPVVCPDDRPWHFLPLSAKRGAALSALALRYHEHLHTHPDLPLADLCYTAAVGRNHFAQRLGLVAQNPTELLAKLAAVGAGEEMANVVRGRVSQAPPRIAFLFTGQGSQYVGMGRELYQTQPTFRRVLDRCEVVAQEVLGRSLIELLYPTAAPENNDLMESHPCGQAVNFALECALVEMWKAWGIQPDVVLGHSLGDFAAAYTAGVLSLEDGLRLVIERGRLMERALGTMVSVGASASAVAPFVERYDDVVIGVINGPRSVVISGGHTHVMAADAALQAAGFKTKVVAVPMAAHSPLLDPVLDEFEARVRSLVTLALPRLPVVSSMTGKLVTAELTDPTYWRLHLRNPVRFADGVTTLAAEGCTIFIEIGPKPTLLGMVGQIVEATPQVALLPTLHQEHDARQQMLTAVAELYVRGVGVDWANLYDVERRHKVLLPTYPFQRQRYWLDVPKAARAQRGVRPLIDKMSRLPLHNERLFETAFSTATLPFLTDHRVYGAVVSPGACQLAMVLSAAEVAFAQPTVQLEDIIFPTAFVVPERGAATAQLVFTPTATNGTGPQTAFKLISFVDDAEPATHASGQVTTLANATRTTVDLAALQARCGEAVDVAAFYAAAAAGHLDFGPSFRWITELWQGDGESLSKLTLPTTIPSLSGYRLHPGLLDGCFQTAGLARRADEAVNHSGEAVMPFAIDTLDSYGAATGQSWWCHAVQTGARTWNLTLLDEQGGVLMVIQGFAVRVATFEAVHKAPLWHDWLYQVDWPTAPLGLAAGANAPENTTRHWLLLADEGGTGAALADELCARGDTVTLARVGTAYQQVAAQTFTLRPDVAADYQQLLAALPPIDGVVHLWSLDLPTVTAAAHTATDLEQAAQQSAGTLLHLSQALLQRAEEMPRLWLVTQNAQAVVDGDDVAGVAQAYLWGMGRVIALEHPELHCVRIDLDGRTTGGAQAARLSQELVVGQTQPADAWEDQIALRNGLRHVARLGRYQPTTPVTIPAAPYRVEIAARGTIDNLVLKPVDRRTPGKDEVEIRVRAAGLNFRNVLDVLGILPYNLGDAIGDECAGEVVSVGAGVTNFQVGDRVVAIAYGSFSHYVTTTTTLVARMPDNLSYADAASLPINFLTAHYGLHQLAQLKPGDKVLVHAATGGTGMAAVQIAQAAGAEVYGTASPGKWETLREMGVRHLYNSRTLDFADAILADTAGRGVDIVFNALTGEGFVEKSMETLAAGGRFIEIARRGIWTDEKVAEVRPDITYHQVDFSQTIPQEPGLIGALLVEVLARFADGKLTPVPQVTFPLHRVADAFRHMQNARHIGKILLVPPQANDEAVAAPVKLHADATYLITGGLGGIGWLVAEHFVANGARHLILLGRSAPTPEVAEKLAALRATGAEIVVAQADVTDREQVAAVLAGIDLAYPLRGVVHAAGVLDDGALGQQTWARFRKVLAPKVWGAWNLHTLTQTMPLDFFTLFASGAGLLGNRGQANHAAANTFLDALAHYRRGQNLPAQSIDWGAWAEVGAAAALVQRSGTQMAAQGIGSLSPTQGIAVFAHLLQQTVTQVGVLPIDWTRYPLQQPFYRALASAMVPAQTEPTGQASLPSLTEQLATTPLGERADLVLAYVQAHTARVLGFADPQTLPTGEGVADLGMDSLTAVELRNRLQVGLACKLPATLVFDYPTVDAIATYLSMTVLAAWMTEMDETLVEKAEILPASATINGHLPVNGFHTPETAYDADDDLSMSEITAQLAAKLGIEVNFNE